MRQEGRCSEGGRGVYEWNPTRTQPRYLVFNPDPDTPNRAVTERGTGGAV